MIIKNFEFNKLNLEKHKIFLFMGKMKDLLMNL